MKIFQEGTNILKPLSTHTAYKPKLLLVQFYAKKNFLSSTPLNHISVVYRIFCKNCICAYLGKIGYTGLLSIQDHKRYYKSNVLKSKLACHALDTNHVPDFECTDILMSGITNLR